MDIPVTWHFWREVKITTDIGDRYIHEEFSPYLFSQNGHPTNFLLQIPPVVSYPDARAVNIRLLLHVGGDVNESNEPKYYQIKSYALKSHKIYNYAFCITNETTTGSDPEYLLFDNDDVLFHTINGFPVFSDVCGEDGIEALFMDDRYYLDKNRVQVSRANNALYYPSMYSYQFGNSATEILAFACQSAPVSPGQFGQFPLSVFTSQGIYLLQQGNGKVLYSNYLPLNNEVALKNSVCELGGAIIYASTDGIKLLSGNRVAHLSRDVEGEPSNKLTADDNYIDFITDPNGKLVFLYPYLSAENFLDYLDDNVRICFDKMNKEIIITNRDLFTNPSREYSSDYSYVYNLPDKTWHKITDSWHQFLLVDSRWVGCRNYRTGYATGQGVYEMTIEDSVVQDCLIQSRPMKWGSYDLKKMKTIIQRSLCYVGDPIDSSQDADDKFGLYMFASMENDLWKFVKGIQVSQPAGHIQAPALPSVHASVRNIVLLTAVRSKDFVLSHWEVVREITMPGNPGSQSRKNTETLSGDYNPDDYSSDYNLYAETL